MNYTTEYIEALHSKYAPCKSVYDLIVTHSNIVYDIALQLVSLGDLHLDMETLRIGVMLHDIGVHPLFDKKGQQRKNINYITHGVVGEEILIREGLPESIWRFASHHTGVGLSKDDIVNQKLPLPVADYMAETAEELLVMYADKFHSKTTPPYFNSFDWYKHDIAKFGSDKVITFQQMANKFGIPDLIPLAAKYGFAIR